jgi:hypothetical protein
MPKWAAIIAGISVIVIIIIACTGADVDPPGMPGDFRPGPRHCFPDGRGPTLAARRIGAIVTRKCGFPLVR